MRTGSGCPAWMTERSRILSDLSEKDIDRMRSPMMRAALYRVKGDEMMLRDTYGMLYRIETENLEKGSAERQRRIALKMLEDSMPISKIVDYTELSAKEIEKLAKDIRKQG